MTSASETIQTSAKRNGIEISGHFHDAVASLSQSEAHLSVLYGILDSQGGPSDINLPLQHEIYILTEEIEGMRVHAEYHLGRAAAKKAASAGFIGDMPSSALPYVSY